MLVFLSGCRVISINSLLSRHLDQACYLFFFNTQLVNYQSLIGIFNMY